MKILIIQLGRIGDTILTTPLFKVLKKNIDDLELHVLAGRNNYHFLLEHPFINKVFVYNKKIFNSIFIMLQLRKQKFDYLIDIKDHYSNESLLFAKLINSKTKIGFNRKGKQTFNINPHEDLIGEKNHYTAIALRPIKYLDIPQNENLIRPNLYENKVSKKDLDLFLKENRINNYLCLNISATDKSRTMLEENWNELLKLIAMYKKLVLLIADPKDSALGKALANRHLGVFYYATKSIIDVFSVVKNSEFVITVDTAIVHIASAFNKPQLCFYVNFPHKIIEFKPLSEKFKIIKSNKIGNSVSSISIDDAIKGFNEFMEEIN